MLAEKPLKCKTFSQTSYMRVARWMVGYRSSHSYGRYEAILDEMHKSQPKAGGPALRLAQAIWDYDYRCLFPKDKRLVVAEENSFSHLRNRHWDNAHRYYHVWKAMKLFIDMREATFGMALLPTIEQPPVSTPHPVRHALRVMDDNVCYAPKRIRQHFLLKHVLANIGKSNPADEEIILPVIEAARGYTVWLTDTTQGEVFETFQKATNLALSQQYKNQAYLLNLNPALNEAINGLHRALSNIPA